MSPLTYEQAEALAIGWIDANCGSGQAVVMPEHTIAKPYGWVFFYQSREYVETGDEAHVLLGNAPLIVNREDGRLHVTGTARPVEHYLTEYEASLTGHNLPMQRTGTAGIVSVIRKLLGRGSGR